MTQYISLPSDSIVVPEKIFLARAGISPRGKIHQGLKEQMEKAKELCKELSELKALYDTVDFEVIDEKKFKIEEKIFESRMVNVNFKGCTRVTLLVATLGDKVPDKIDTLFQNDQYSLAFLLDAFASEFLEYFVNRVNEFLRKDMLRKRWVGSKRISPGYEDLSLKFNAFIIQRLNTESKIGVKFIEDSYMLVPRKSITALIGWKRF